MVRILSAYLQWHFTTGLREVFELGKNMSWFGYHFFSIPLLFKTLLRPIYRVHETAPPGGGIHIELFFENFTINMIARVVGFFLRVILIACGILYQIVLLTFAPLLFAGWIILPFLPFVFIIVGIGMIF